MEGLNLRIIEEKKQELLERKELNIDMTYSGAVPSRTELAKEVAKIAKTKEELVAVRKVETKFGFGKGKITAYVYNDAKVLDVTEKKYTMSRGKPKDKAEAAPAKK